MLRLWEPTHIVDSPVYLLKVYLHSRIRIMIVSHNEFVIISEEAFRLLSLVDIDELRGSSVGLAMCDGTTVEFKQDRLSEGDKGEFPAISIRGKNFEDKPAFLNVPIAAFQVMQKVKVD